MPMEFHWEEEKLGKAYDAGLMRRLLGFVKPYKWLFGAAIVLAFIITATELAIPAIILKVGVDQFLTPAVTGGPVGAPPSVGAAPADPLAGIVHWAWILGGVLVVRFLASVAQRYILEYSGQRVMYDMRTEVFGQLMRLPVRFYDTNPVGRLVTRATNDVAAINEMYTAVLVNAFQDIFLLVGIFGVLLAVSWQLTLIIAVLLPLIVWITMEFRKRARDAYREVRRKLAKLNAYVSESLSGMRVTQLFVRERDSHAMFASINREEYDAQMRQLKIFSIFQPMIGFTRTLGLGLIALIGGYATIEGVITVGTLGLFWDYTERLFRPIRDLAERYNILQGAMAASERIFELLDQTPERYEGERGLPRLDGRIEFRDVWFSYQEDPSESDWVLQGVSFTVEPGERVAIVGPTGSGKSTIINLILRLYEIQHGQIRVDGVDIREVPLEELRQEMAVVLQDVFMFSGDILSNIRLQDEEIPREEAIDAARFVQADEFIQELPDEYDTEVKERGSTLSVGERQLLAFARAVAFDPKILILDEATANIDSQTESLIQDSIERILEGRTSIVIAHRLSTIRNSDVILVLHKGQLVEQGTHDELMNEGGMYHALYSLQFDETGPRPLSEEGTGAHLELGED